MFEWIFRRCRGFVRLSITGDGTERFFNLLNTREIYVWDVIREGESVVFYIYVDEVKRLREILRKTKTKMRILERCGLPFFLFFYRKRKMFVAGMFTGWLLVYIMSMYVWNISFEGNMRHTDDELMKYMETIDIVEGMRKDKVKPEEIEKAIRNKYFDITWSSVEISGTILKIHIRENSSQLELNQFENVSESTGNILASKNATVVSIITRAGTPLIKKGATVKKGDMLIEGKYNILSDDLTVMEERYVKADGDIIGQVVYNISEKIDRNYIKKQYTGESIQINSYKWNNDIIQIKFPWENINYKNYDKVEVYNSLSIGNSFYLPVKSGITEYREYKMSNEKYSDDELKKLAEEKILYILKKIEENTIQIVENNVKIEVGENECLISGDIIVLEYIGSIGDTYE